ncbi:MAG: peptidylprolyl isomerase [Bacilli bacterium]
MKFTDLKTGSVIAGTCLGAAIVGVFWAVASAQGQGGPVIASVGGTAIHSAALDSQMAKVAGPGALTTMITQQLLTDAAKKDHVVATAADVQAALASLEQQNGITSQAQLSQALAQSNLTLSELQSQLKLQVLAQKIAASQVRVTNAEITQYYTKNAKTLRVPAKVRLSAIFLKNKAAADAVARKLQGGYSFAAAAKKYSLDKTTANKGGVMGTFAYSQLDPATAKAAFSQPVGRAGAPVKGASGWEILKVTSKIPSSKPSMASVRAQIISAIKSQKAQTTPELLASLAKAAPISIQNSAYSSVKTSIENPPVSTTTAPSSSSSSAPSSSSSSSASSASSAPSSSSSSAP